MIRPELFKIRHHRTPWAIAGVFALAVLALPTWFAFRPPADAELYLTGVREVASLVGVLLAPVFGSWLVGHEYRQGTLRRVAAIDARRGRLLATKAGLGAVVMTAGIAAISAIGVGASALVASINNHSLTYDGLVRDFAADGFAILVVGAVAFALSVILRSDTYAMLASLAVMVVLAPLLTLIPTIGKYMPSVASERIADWIAEAEANTQLGLGAAALTLTLILGTLAIGATGLFRQRDI